MIPTRVAFTTFGLVLLLYVRSPLGAIGTSVFLASLGTSIANVGLPTMADHFGTSPQQVQWVVVSYLVATTALIVGAGRLGDMLGRKRMLLVGIAIFTFASVLCTIAPSLLLLLAARALQGTGAALMLALSFASAGDCVPRDRIGRAMGFIGTASAVGTALGPSLGGALIAEFGWEALFAIFLPLGAVAALLIVWNIPTDRSTRTSLPFDAAGTLTLAASLSFYALSMTLGGGFGTLNLTLLAAAAAGALLFLRVEKKAIAPLVDLKILSQPPLRSALALNALVATVVMASLIVGPFYLTNGLGLGAVELGAVMSVGPTVAALAGVPSGRLVGRMGATSAITLGLSAAGLGSLTLAMLPENAGIGGYVAAVAILTAGYALFQSANNTAVMAAAKAEERGVISGLLGLARSLGLVTGASAMGALYATASVASAATGLHVTFAAASVLLVIAVFVHLNEIRSAARAGDVAS